MRTLDAHLRPSVWDPRVPDGLKKERTRQSSGLRMRLSSVNVRFPLRLSPSLSQSLCLPLSLSLSSSPSRRAETELSQILECGGQQPSPAP